jgi:hypothetical protein
MLALCTSMPELRSLTGLFAPTRIGAPGVIDDEDEVIRAHVRMRLAFWEAQDRRSISTGPEWLWRGRFDAPLRPGDLSPATAQKISRRRAKGVAPVAAFDDTGPRQCLMPRWVSVRVGLWWTALAVLLGVVAAICAPAGDDRVRVGVAAGWAAAGCALLAAAAALAVVWGRRDPLRLAAAERAEVAAARRDRGLQWNPLAGAGPITAAGAYLMEGIAVVERLKDSSAWRLPGVEVLRWRFDPDEEIFQIARGARALRVYDGSVADLRARTPTGGRPIPCCALNATS